MIRISQNAWDGLENETVVSDGIKKEVTTILKHAVNSGLGLWLTDEEGNLLRQFSVVNDKLLV